MLAALQPPTRRSQTLTRTGADLLQGGLTLLQLGCLALCMLPAGCHGAGVVGGLQGLQLQQLHAGQGTVRLLHQHLLLGGCQLLLAPGLSKARYACMQAYVIHW